jgi:stress response protein SCP2
MWKLICTIARTTGAVDLDASAFLLGPRNRVRSDADFVFYNQPTTPDGSVQVVTTESAEDVLTTETIELDLDAIEPDVARVLLAASVDRGSLTDIRDLGLIATGAGCCAPISIAVEESSGSALVFAEISRRNSGWWLRALRRDYTTGLRGLARDSGVDVE